MASRGVQRLVSALDENAGVATRAGGFKTMHRPAGKTESTGLATRQPLQSLGLRNNAQPFVHYAKAFAATTEEAAAPLQARGRKAESDVLQDQENRDGQANVVARVKQPQAVLPNGYVELPAQMVVEQHMGTYETPNTAKDMSIMGPDPPEDEISDIDAGDEHYPEYVSEYVCDIYDYLYARQELFMVPEDLFRRQPDITPKMRAVLIDWLVDVHLKFKLMHETLFLTVNTIDRYLAAVPVPRSKLQLTGVVSMLIASKMEEIYAPEVRDFVYITDKAYSKEEIQDTETNMLNTLQFRFGVPLPLHFLRRMSKSADATPQLHTLAKYFLELSMISTTMLKHSPSRIAAASLCLATKMLNLEWTPTMAYYSHYTENDIVGCLLDLFDLVKKASTSRFQASRRKYQMPRFFQVANIADAQARNVLPSSP